MSERIVQVGKTKGASEVTTEEFFRWIFLPGIGAAAFVALVYSVWQTVRDLKRDYREGQW